MQNMVRYVMAAVLAGLLATSTSALAGDCCTKSAKLAAKGKACEKCLPDACCKKAAAKAAKEAGVSSCTKCAKADKQGKKSAKGKHEAKEKKDKKQKIS